MSAYLNLTVEKFFEECKQRVLLDKVRVAQKQTIKPGESGPSVWHTYFLLTAIDIPENVILRCTVPISSTLSNPWEKDNPFENDTSYYKQRHEKILKLIEEVAAKHYPAFGDKEGKLKEGEWAWD